MQINSVNNYKFNSLNCENGTKKSKINQSLKEVLGDLQPLEQDTVSFKGRTCAKEFTGFFGSIGTLGSIIGSFILAGEFSLPFVLFYGGFSAIAGYIMGREIPIDALTYLKRGDVQPFKTEQTEQTEKADKADKADKAEKAETNN